MRTYSNLVGLYAKRQGLDKASAKASEDDNWKTGPEVCGYSLT